MLPGVGGKTALPKEAISGGNAIPRILYDWRPPVTRGWAYMPRPVTHVRGLMNSGKDYARSLLGQVGGVRALEDRKDMCPWVFEARASALVFYFITSPKIRCPLKTQALARPK